jgi:hypothetical protein
MQRHGAGARSMLGSGMCQACRRTAGGLSTPAAHLAVQLCDLQAVARRHALPLAANELLKLWVACGVVWRAAPGRHVRVVQGRQVCFRRPAARSTMAITHPHPHPHTHTHTDTRTPCTHLAVLACAHPGRRVHERQQRHDRVVAAQQAAHEAQRQLRQVVCVCVCVCVRVCACV